MHSICFSWETIDTSLQQYSLAFFIAGDRAAEWHTLDELSREHAILEHLAHLVGPELADEARSPVEVNYVEWSKEPHLGGAPTSSMPPGLLRQHGATLPDPFKLIHFAGGETAFEWKGYLEGALLAGQRAATEVIQAVGPRKP